MQKIVADLHLHSAYARATSKNLNFDSLTQWGKIKGIDLLSSADFTHPLWFEETKKKLKEDGSGLLFYNGLKFILGAEVSCIFSQGGKLRRVHLLLYVPSLVSAEKVNQELGKRGKLASDGRPILGLTARNVLEILLEVDPSAIMIPAHVWTPWFGVLGQNGGFDSLEECFGDLTKYIYAVESGLSSDPAMNWRIKELDDRSIVSFSDAHSAPKMGRELTVFKTELSYKGLLNALKSAGPAGLHPAPTSSPLAAGVRAGTPRLSPVNSALVPMESRKSSQPSAWKILSTIEFFPEEGKYHYNGHRNCNFSETPEQTLKRGLLCPNCRRPLTIGVMHRVAQLADENRSEGYIDKKRPTFKKLVPLQEIIAETLGSPITSKKVIEKYLDLIKKFGSEIDILTKLDSEKVGNYFGQNRLGEALEKVRKGDIFINPGYDGVFGEVHIFEKGQNSKGKNQNLTKRKQENNEPTKEDNNQLNLFDK